jgi:hypothetical protein
MSITMSIKKPSSASRAEGFLLEGRRTLQKDARETPTSAAPHRLGPTPNHTPRYGWIGIQTQGRLLCLENPIPHGNGAYGDCIRLSGRVFR